ncbi:MAG: radical SAM protein, partial [bacterium]
SWPELTKELTDFQPDFLFISVTSFTIHDDLVACQLAKELLGAGIRTVAKGAHVAVKAREVLAECPHLDVAISGEYELAAGELAAQADWRQVLGITFRDPRTGEIVTTPARPFLAELDRIPFPARHLLDNALYQRPDTGKPQTTVQTSRGCPAACIFCLAPTVYGSKIRVRTPANVVAELKACAEQLGIRDFFFRADTFTWNKQWVLDLCRAIVEEKLDIRWVCNSRVDTIDDERLEWMKKAGCHGIAFGVESGVQEALNRMKKGSTVEKNRAAVALCKKHGMMTLLYFIVGLPWDTAEEIRRSIDFAVELGGDLVEFHTAIPFPGTELYDIARRDRLYDEELDGYNYTRSPLRTYHLTSKQLLALRREANRRLYLTPATFLRMGKLILQGARSPRQLWKTISFGTTKLANLVLAKEEAR